MFAFFVFVLQNSICHHSNCQFWGYEWHSYAQIKCYFLQTKKTLTLSHWMNLVTFELSFCEISAVCRGFSVLNTSFKYIHTYKLFKELMWLLFTVWKYTVRQDLDKRIYCFLSRLHDSSKSAWSELEFCIL